MKRGRPEHPNKPKSQAAMLELLNRVGSVSKAQEHLGISGRSIANWIYEFDIKKTGDTFTSKPLRR